MLSPDNVETYQGIMAILESHDVRNSSGVELRLTKGIYSSTIIITVMAKPVLSSVIFEGSPLGEDLIETFITMFQEKVEDLKPVSRNPRARAARDNRDCKREYLTDAIEVNYEEKDRYDNHIVSELLPNYHISLRDVLTDEPLDEIETVEFTDYLIN